jgi:hypothetical protein
MNHQDLHTLTVEMKAVDSVVMLADERDDWKVALKVVCMVVCLVGVLDATTVSTLVEQMDV